MMLDSSNLLEVKMEKEQDRVKSKYLFQLTDNNQKISLYIAIILSIISGLMTFVPYIMIFKTILFLLSNGEIKSVCYMDL